MAEKDQKALAVELLDMAQKFAVEALKESRWYKSAPAAAKTDDPEIFLTGVQYHDVHVYTGGIATGSYPAPFIVGETTVGGIKANLRFRIELGKGDIVVDELVES